MPSRIFDLAQAIGAVGLLAMAGLISSGLGHFRATSPPAAIAVQLPATAQAEPGGDMGPQETGSTVEWMMRQGGAFAVLAVVLFFYRRDYRGLNLFWLEQQKLTAEMVASSTKAQTETAAALRENTIVVRETKDVLARATELMAQHRGD